MSTSPILLVHISGGIVGLLSGFAAMTFRKGSRRHGLAGNIFFVSMMCMSSAATYLAIVKSQAGNVFGGILTFYLVLTGWLTARRKDGETSPYDWAALIIPLVTGAVILTFGVEAAQSPTGSKAGVPAGMYFFMGAISLLSAAGDIRMLVRGGLYGVHRVTRHLWRMCYALFVASGSLFIARPHLFPVFMRKTGMLILLGVLPLIMLIFWLIRVRFAKAYKRIASARASSSERRASSKTLPVAGLMRS